MNNPYPEFLVDEASGIQVPDIRHQLWGEGYRAGKEEMLGNIHLALDRAVERSKKGRESAFHFEAFPIGKELKQCRFFLGLTLKQLSARSGVSASHIARLERGERSPGYDIVLKLGKALEEVRGRQ